MDPIQYILLALIALFYLRILRAYSRGKIHTQDILVWTLFWAVPVVIVVKPNLTQQLADLIGIGRGVDLVVYVSVFFIYYLFYMLLTMHKELDEKVTALGRAIAHANAIDNRNKNNGSTSDSGAI